MAKAEIVKIENYQDALQQTDSLETQAQALVIVNQASYDQAAEWLKVSAALVKAIKKHHEEPKAKAKAAHQAICDAEKRALAPHEKIRALLSPKIAEWDRKQKEIERQLQQQRERLLKQQEEEARLQLADHAHQMGASPETVDMILETPQPVPVAPKMETYQRQAGVTVMQEKFVGGVTDSMALLRAVLDGRAPTTFVKWSATEINAWANATKGTANLPGLEAVPEQSNIQVRG
jgi:hypothetical protein